MCDTGRVCVCVCVRERERDPDSAYSCTVTHNPVYRNPIPPSVLRGAKYIRPYFVDRTHSVLPNALIHYNTMSTKNTNMVALCPRNREHILLCAEIKIDSCCVLNSLFYPRNRYPRPTFILLWQEIAFKDRTHFVTCRLKKCIRTKDL